MQKTYSQKIARVFEIVDYLLLIPATLGALLATLVFGGLTLLVYGFYIGGVVLLVGYFKHSRGRLSEGKIGALWIGSAVYNFILLLPCLYVAAVLLQSKASQEMSGDFLFVVAVVFGYIGAIAASIRAFLFESRKKPI